MFITDSQLLDLIAAALKVGGGQAALVATAPYWSTLASEANTAAYNEIVARLTARGFTPAQIAAWDRGAEFQKNIGLYWALVKGGALDGFDDRFIRALNQYVADVRDVLVTNGGVWQVTGDTPGTVSTGAFTGSNDLFGTPIDRDDPRLGDTVRF
jgi:hypothetical protein